MSGLIINNLPHSVCAVAQDVVQRLARSMATRPLGQSIRVNIISDGMINTRFGAGSLQADLRFQPLENEPLGMRDPEHPTRAVTLSCRDAGKFIAGIDVKY